MRKYIFISGGVLSGLGKGVVTASISLLLKSSGLKVVPIKCENYLNYDAGTINPIEHGDVFLCEDGAEVDMDIGSYEKFLGIEMCKNNFITMGQIYRSVLDRERRFEYHGEDVQEVIHITEEVITRINKAMDLYKADISVVELGGTAGELQNTLYYEASRKLKFNNPGSVIHIHVSYVPTPKHLGEPKTKPVQQSVKQLYSMGIVPDLLIIRSESKLDQRRKERLSLFCQLQAKDVISNYDVESVYDIPYVLERADITKSLCKKLNITYKNPNLSSWKKITKKINKKKAKQIAIGIVGKYFATGDHQLKDSYAALFDAIDHAAAANNITVKVKWIGAESIEKKGAPTFLRNLQGIIVPIGWGERGVEGKIKTASYARKNNIPYLGLCYGMQLAAVAFARDILKLRKANTTESDPNTKHPVVHLMPSQKDIIKRRAYGGTMRLGGWDAYVKKGSLIDKIYARHNGYKNSKTRLISERHRHRYEFNNLYVDQFEKKGMFVSARSKVENLVEMIELDTKIHPFYIGTQAHPEYKSRPSRPHPIFIEFLRACRKFNKKKS